MGLLTVDDMAERQAEMVEETQLEHRAGKRNIRADKTPSISPRPHENLAGSARKTFTPV